MMTSIIITLLLAFSNMDSVSSTESRYLRKSPQHQQSNGVVKNTKKSLRGDNVVNTPKEESDFKCVLQLVETEYHDREDEHHWECMDESTGRFLDLNIDFDEDYKDPVAGHIESGRTLLQADVVIRNGPHSVLIGSEPKLSIIPQDEHRRRLANRTSGNKSVLVVRVEAKDASTGPTEEDLARDVFGITDSKGETDSWNLSSGFDQCSYGKLTFGPTKDHRMKNGVYTISINENVNGQRSSDLKNTILDQLQSELGATRLDSLYDHVMLCLPPGTVSKSGYGQWYGYGTVNGFVTILNNEWCSSASLQMHEIGHNLGLEHNFDGGKQYEDVSGVMGHSFNIDDGPIMCFNSAKNWQLGWYEDKHTTVKPLHEDYWEGKLVGYAKYDEAPADSSVIIKVEGHNRDFYIGFNHKVGINRQNQEMDAANKITVHSVGTTNRRSELEAKLGIGETFGIPNFGGESQSILIQVHNIDMNANPPEATISINQMKCTSDSDCDDDTLCTIDKCNISTGMCTHQGTPSCPGFMEMVLLTDRYPKESSWNIVDTCDDNKVVMSGGNYDEAFQTYKESAILPPSKYRLTVSDAFGDGMCCKQGDGSFHATYDSEVVAEGGAFGKTSSHTWGSCDAAPITDAPTAAPTSCEITYELTISKPANIDPLWKFVFDENPAIIAAASSSGDSWSGSTFTQRGCLPDNCYDFTVENAASYSLKIDDSEVVTASKFTATETTLFGTCQPISVA